MPTLYIRDVPDEVVETLKERAAAEGKSLSTYVAGELSKIASRPTNAQIVAAAGAGPVGRPNLRGDRRGRPGRPTVSVVDASAMVEALEVPLLTCDTKLDAGGHRAQIVVVSRTHWHQGRQVAS
jgi:hypothetical protein